MSKRKKHETYTARTTRGDTLLKCRCGIELVAGTKAEAEAAHDEAAHAMGKKTPAA